MLSSSSPARRALANQRSSSRRSGPCAASDASRRVAVTNVPTPGRGVDQPSVLKLPVSLEHGVRIDRQLSHHVLDRGQLITLLQQAQTQCPADLVHDLTIRREA